MKTKLLRVDGSEGKEIQLPRQFSHKIREDIVARAILTEISIQPYAPFIDAGKGSSGKMRHRRHRWGSHYGRGISRVPRKSLWRRGTQFYWVGATAPSTRGGRRAHPPKIEQFLKKVKINKKEKNIALAIAISATANKDKIKFSLCSIQIANEGIFII